MISTTADKFEGLRVTAYRGVVYGVAVRTPTISQSFSGRLRYLIGGEIESYSDMSEESHEFAYREMLERAKKKGANAVLKVRYESSLIVPKHSASEVLCYGTAVIVEKERSGRQANVGGIEYEGD